jgi:RNA polymerase sigma factor (sigma-70 family)
MVFATLKFNRLKKSQKDAVLAEAEQRLKRIFFHEDFEKRAEVKKILGPMPNLSIFLDELRSIRSKYCFAGDNFQSRIFYESPLLTKDQEIHLFRQYNFYKYRAKKRLNKKEISDALRDLVLAEGVRNTIAAANLRLCIPIVKKIGEPHRNEDLFSESCDLILKSVDYFDPNRGFKFSTYATWVLKNNLYRALKSWRNFEEKNSTRLNEFDNLAVADHDFGMVFKQTDRCLVIKKMLERCDEREKKVIERRFFESKKLIEIATEFGLSKERIRQIETRALEKIKKHCERIGISFDCF